MYSNFLQTVEDVHRGELLEDIETELQKLVAAIRERSGSGSLSIKLTIKHAGDSRVAVDGQVTAKLPEKKRPASTFYATDSNSLSRNDPSQVTMRFEDVPKRDAKFIDPSTN